MDIFKVNFWFKRFFSLFLFVCVFFTLGGNAQVNFFSNPYLCSYEEFAKELKEKKFDMSWHFTQDSYFQVSCKENEVYFEICLGVLPDSYKDFFMKWKDKFIEKQFEKSKQLIFSYKVKEDGTEEINVAQCGAKKAHPDEYSYIVTNRRVVENATPQLINQFELEDIMKNNNTLFYTGAGLSVDAGVPAMNELMDLLGMEEGEKFFHFLEGALNNSKEFASKISAFYKSCFYSSPTKAHYALKELAEFKNKQIVTENFDNLHESSGIYPYRINPNQLRDEVGSENLAKIDYIICIGLSYDDKGFLGWYKENNPKGKIIAIDLQKPSYLGDEDFLLIGNLQEILPSIQRNIMQ